jgi:hypothetical protein
MHPLDDYETPPAHVAFLAAHAQLAEAVRGNAEARAALTNLFLYAESVAVAYRRRAGLPFSVPDALVGTPESNVQRGTGGVVANTIQQQRSAAQRNLMCVGAVERELTEALLERWREACTAYARVTQVDPGTLAVALVA